MSAAYPPQPWDLTGRGWVSSWSLSPRARLPQLPAGVAPLGRLALTMFVSYAPPGQMTYAELLAGVLVRDRAQVGLAITDIWVDSPASRAGGRELWGVPKDLAEFDLDGAAGPTASEGLLCARADGRTLATAAFTASRAPGVPLPLRLPAAIVQTVPVGPVDAPGARTRWTPISARARALRPARARWSSPADGPLGWLADARSRASILVEDFDLRFGS
ncbi:acetoacetate decarboxylase family protein [Nocardioides zeae]|uniref:Acetoacetate decarboxylase family protein n=1 Tax=Nocardioides imazamoxiresistens TaxID=3231893 RepID=A0ABU3Q101_9ACTN|nr:acetoacetate decarboxylase family protein [Nocardioides zeae]MDT9595187.1 acetoacetate decarboxylase family protein [Nocardioides zeae]